MNPLFNNFGNQSNQFTQIIQQARDFRKSFTGNPREEVQKLLNSGAMSQKTFNELSQIARQVAQLMDD